MIIAFLKLGLKRNVSGTFWFASRFFWFMQRCHVISLAFVTSDFFPKLQRVHRNDWGYYFLSKIFFKRKIFNSIFGVFFPFPETAHGAQSSSLQSRWCLV